MTRQHEARNRLRWSRKSRCVSQVVPPDLRSTNLAVESEVGRATRLVVRGRWFVACASERTEKGLHPEIHEYTSR